MARIEVRGAEQMAELAKRLKGADAKVRRRLSKSIRDGVRPAVADTKRAVLAIPVTGARGGGGKARTEHHLTRVKDPESERARKRAAARSGLRRSIAAAIKADIQTGGRKAGVRIVVDANKLPQDQRTLPRHLNSKRGWRHPLFGDRDRWYAQSGKPWFEVTIRKHVRKIRRTILKAMDELAKEIES
ncbi:hypothetical protein HNP84_007323 [Thermocatellispora tengchongensis]|uniref:HK97 gp10 family phage protein n=1 Tax=Thermocatellispora tengchongensis TaxID=1073253 RepID=A0A840PIE6_9ACTN|nr:hypothetical protein [Thermocatellispora tengchongensis]MBB5137571.1 hypothetical protein [Thermocatellispora tengchongensis]